MRHTRLELRWAYGFPRDMIDLGEPLASFPRLDGLGDVRLHEVDGRLYVTYPRKSLKDAERGYLYREVCPWPEVKRHEWGLATSHQCHTADPSHPWNTGSKRPGYHDCGACGYPTWHEIHGVAAGFCVRCGYHG